MDVARDECRLSAMRDATLFLVNQFLPESIDINQNFELELTKTGPQEIVDVNLRLVKSTWRDDGNDNPSAWPGDGHKLTLTVKLLFRNSAHIFHQNSTIKWDYKLKASVQMMHCGKTCHLPFPLDSARTRDANTLDFDALEYVFAGFAYRKIEHVCLNVTRTKVDYTDARNPFAVPDNFGRDFGWLYRAIVEEDSSGDVKLRMKGNNWLWAHKAVLSAKSSSFELYFRHNPHVNEINLEEAEILQNAEPGVVTIMREFFYTNELDCAKLGSCSHDLCDLLVQLYHFAHRNGLENLKTACLDNMKFAVIDNFHTATKYQRFAKDNGLSHMYEALEQLLKDTTIPFNRR